ncbi:MmpL efflux pump [Trypanosoma cruzi]|uniref:SSD domain-containing protein n=2 Tax=Trypanosoma cruzi TaxID=5693 RepID=Q4DFK7_TRYCC|nr:hypothetical protein, conserved [Trypanosoma cruzi]EAN91297.1 hypothetical protein, conserved [Trypanosoma cruzi]KAF5226374.1 hypothetical protein ECC02_000498 [Trypanosoma cruzi]RNC60747.1 MmpL efflux pump [Trypanosoma cruzi]|eukprot:XP_813148.1 hypothetical protein [Trypanosoma cruzi strain CL Brener]
MLKEKKLAMAMMLLYCILLPVMAYFSWKFINNTGLTFTAPKKTIVYDAMQTAELYFPHQLPLDPLYMLLTSRNKSKSILEDPHFEPFCEYLVDQVKNKSSPFFGVVEGVDGFCTIPNYSSLRYHLIGGDHNESSLITIILSSSVDSRDVLPTIVSVVDTWCDLNDAQFTREYTDKRLISRDATGGIVGDLFRVDVISIPMAFMVLVYCVGSVRLLLIPLFTLPCTVSIAFGIMYPISLWMEVSSFAPEMTLGVVAALSIDYSLFILTRFREQVTIQELLLGRNPKAELEVVKNTATMSADIICVSGIAVSLAVGILALLPVLFLSTIGLTMSITVLCAVFVSLTVQPALLLIFYDFFGHPPTWNEVWHKLRTCCGCGSSLPPDSLRTDTDEDASTAMPQDPLLVDSEMSRSELELLEYEGQMSSYWFKIGRMSFRHPWIAAAIVLILGAPFFYFALQLRMDFNVFTQIPRNSHHGNVLRRIQHDIGKGSSIPFYILFSVRGTYDISFWKTNEMTNTIKSVIEDIVATTGQPYSSIISPNMIMKNEGDAVYWLNSWESFLLYYTNKEYEYLFKRTVSFPGNKAAFIFVTPPVNPFGASANRYLNQIYDVLKKHASANVYFDYGILGASSASWAIMNESLDFFPFQIVVALGGIFIIIMVIFRSLFLPVRLIATVIYTIGVSFGVGVVVFQYNWLHPVWKALDGVGNFCFLIPLFAFLFLSALSLDYDVFLTTRIIEFKKKGYNDEAAIAKAVWKTGPIISFAGIIMFLTIGSMAFSSVMMLSQFAVVCATAVLLDTFVVRPLFVPALMGLGFGRSLWWPRRFPELKRDVHDMRIDTTDTSEGLFIEEEVDREAAFRVENVREERVFKPEKPNQRSSALAPGDDLKKH